MFEKFDLAEGDAAIWIEIEREGSAGAWRSNTPMRHVRHGTSSARARSHGFDDGKAGRPGPARTRTERAVSCARIWLPHEIETDDHPGLVAAVYCQSTVAGSMIECGDGCRFLTADDDVMRHDAQADGGAGAAFDARQPDGAGGGPQPRSVIHPPDASMTPEAGADLAQALGEGVLGSET